MLPLFEGIFNGLSIGAVLLVAALGLAVVFGLMGVINLAHGEFMMLGAYVTFVVQNVCKPLGDPWYSAYIIIALPIAFIVTAAIGLALERGVIRFLYGRPLETLLATWGVSLILRQFVRSANGAIALGIAMFCLLLFGGLWVLQRQTALVQRRNWAIAILSVLSGAIAVGAGAIAAGGGETWARPWFSARNVDVTPPEWLRGGIPLGDFQLPSARLFIIALTIACLVGTYWFLNCSRWGLRIRAVTQNRNMSACLGIPTRTVDALTFALGSGLAGLAGVAISLLGSVGPNVGQNYIVDTFMVVVVGGVGKLVGTIVAALAIGTLNYLIGSGTLALLSSSIAALQPLTDFFTFFATTSMAKVMVFAAIVGFLQFRPSGIFPQKGRTVDA
ncbi:branched-chain amino acid ABC-type transport system, permease component [Rubidibacter lacunae KORDI 51-2]|uniref:Branched-chain amino acid ABC-type transport system, permease component n=1 Tax=Rubidibacter lacunae KORDI 51-2 TaxID=582515 RepID=U5D5K0_9CHRO|nr:branched-chain amino acid ABC transporter permease [Rubidibacter lacunae]ERN39948.1 branched-chain amino acid ABC-type transport system, permease component [Rubidibacter lacunae KORDI 51-2]